MQRRSSYNPIAVVLLKIAEHFEVVRTTVADMDQLHTFTGLLDLVDRITPNPRLPFTFVSI